MNILRLTRTVKRSPTHSDSSTSGLRSTSSGFKLVSGTWAQPRLCGDHAVQGGGGEGGVGGEPRGCDAGGVHTRHAN